MFFFNEHYTFLINYFLKQLPRFFIFETWSHICTGTIQLQGGQTVQLVTASRQKIGNNVIRMINPIGNQLVAGGQVQLAQGGKLSLAGNQIIQVGASGPGQLTSGQGIKVSVIVVRIVKFLLLLKSGIV